MTIKKCLHISKPGLQNISYATKKLAQTLHLIESKNDSTIHNIFYHLCNKTGLKRPLIRNKRGEKLNF